MQNKLELSLLIDYYGAFLTDNQCEMLKLNWRGGFFPCGNCRAEGHFAAGCARCIAAR